MGHLLTFGGHPAACAAARAAVAAAAVLAAGLAMAAAAITPAMARQDAEGPSTIRERSGSVAGNAEGTVIDVG